MSKNRRGNQVVRCDHCSGSGWMPAPSNGRQRGSRKTKVQMFETTAAALGTTWGQAGSNGFNSRPTEPEFDPIDQSPMKPGESRKSTSYHQWSVDDVRVTGLIAVGSGLAAILSTVGACIVTSLPWKFVPVAGFGTVAIMWGFKVKDFFIDKKAIRSEQKQKRVQDLPPMPAPAPPSAEIVINDGHKQTRAKLRAPSSNHAGLWLYAQALVAGTAAPSYEGGKGVLGAKTYKYTPAEFDGPRGDEWRPTAIKAGLLEDDPHKSKGYRLTKTGRRAMGAIVKGRIGEWG